MFLPCSRESYSTVNFSGEHSVLVEAELLLQWEKSSGKDLSLVAWVPGNVFSNSGGKCVLFREYLCAIFYGWEESHLSVVYPGQHVWKLQCDERAIRKGERGTENTGKGIRTIKKRGNFLFWCNSEEHFCLFIYLAVLLSTFANQGGVWSAEISELLEESQSFLLIRL